MKPYFQVLEDVAKKSSIGPHLHDYHEKGKFKGGHMVLWNKHETPENYIVEFDLKHNSPLGLFILFFSAQGEQGKNLFDPSLSTRNGVFSQ
jgi:hypothetical protein